MLAVETAGCLSVLIFHKQHVQWLRLLADELRVTADHIQLSIQNLVSQLAYQLVSVSSKRQYHSITLT
jgi:hypothetical protein